MPSNRSESASNIGVSRLPAPSAARSGRRRKGPRRTLRRRTRRGRPPARPARRASPGCPSSLWMANTMPPLAEPSSLVSTTPVSSTASVNCGPASRPFWPVVASSTSSTSVTSPAPLSATRRTLRQLLHQVRLGVEPAGGVGEHEVGAGRCRVGDAVEDHRRTGRRPPRHAPTRRRNARPTSRAARRPRHGTCRRRPSRPCARPA